MAAGLLTWQRVCRIVAAGLPPSLKLQRIAEPLAEAGQTGPKVQQTRKVCRELELRRACYASRLLERRIAAASPNRPVPMTRSFAPSGISGSDVTAAVVVATIGEFIGRICATGTTP